MIDGYLTFDGVEVFNMDRLMAYVGNGYGPPGVVVTDDEACSDFAASLGHGPYRTPVLDGAPWVDVDDPATHDFAGVLPLGVTGLSGTTRTRDVEPRLAGGGVASAPRHQPRTIAVSALLLGRTMQAVDAGEKWLTATLQRICNTTDDAGAVIEGFTACPGPLNRTPNPDAPVTDHLIDGAGDWLPAGGMWDGVTFSPLITEDTRVVDGGTPTGTGPSLSGDGTDGGTPSTVGAEVTDGGTPSTVEEGSLDGGTAASNGADDTLDGGGVVPVSGDVVDGGFPASPWSPADRDGLLAAPLLDSCYGWLEAVWTITPTLTGVSATRVSLGAVDERGFPLDRGPAMGLTEDPATYTLPITPWDTFRPAVWIDGDAEVSLNLRYREPLTTEQCLAPIRRRIPQVVTIEGPVVAEETAIPGCDVVLRRIEWTWVAGDAHRYKTTVPLLTDMAEAEDAYGYRAPGIETNYRGTVTLAATTCSAPAPTESTALWPCRPNFVAPPAPPVIASTGAGYSTILQRTSLLIPPTYVPDNGEAVGTFVFKNDGSPKVGIRLRVWETDNAIYEDLDPCGYAYEFAVDFLAANATLVVDGVTGEVTVSLPDAPAREASRLLRGNYEGPFQHPVFRCNRHYFVTVDVGVTYPTSCTGIYTAGDPQGALAYDVSLTHREG